jgi:hypothetical protein
VRHLFFLKYVEKSLQDIEGTSWTCISLIICVSRLHSTLKHNNQTKRERENYIRYISLNSQTRLFTTRF